jgi:hypothetical protein
MAWVQMSWPSFEPHMVSEPLQGYVLRALPSSLPSLQPPSLLQVLHRHIYNLSTFLFISSSRCTKPSLLAPVNVLVPSQLATVP